MGQKSKKAKQKEKLSPAERNLLAGMEKLKKHPLFGGLGGDLIIETKDRLGAKTAAMVSSNGSIYVNKSFYMPPDQWIFAIAHCELHLAFGHFDEDHVPGYEMETRDGVKRKKASFRPFLWNEACDIYITKFLTDIKLGEPLYDIQYAPLSGGLRDELQIYDYLVEHHYSESEQLFGTAAPNQCDMIGLEKPLAYDVARGEHNHYAAHFAYLMAESVSNAVTEAGGHEATTRADSPPAKAGQWFINHYPLLGGLASHFKIIEDYGLCYQNDIQIAAIDVDVHEIYVNPSCRYSKEQWQFVLAHEYLHAGLQHQERRQGRDPYLWNIACDFVINLWLNEMQIGDMPADGLLYDISLKGMSAESIYDKMLSDMRKYRKMNTFHGNGKGDILGSKEKRPGEMPGRQDRFGKNPYTLDDFCREALQQGLEYHLTHGRGLIPAGLIEEIRALSMPPIPWDVKLAQWFDAHFLPLEKHRTYARPSRRQASTPEIPRPRYTPAEIPENSRTFGVVLDTSGSMGIRDIGMALGSIASYAAAKEVPAARVVFCDAAPYDAGYLPVDEIAGRVKIIGRGGTILQPAVTLLNEAKDFPKNGPILIITDGGIENRLIIKHEHAFLLPKGCRLPFHTKSPVFYFSRS